MTDYIIDSCLHKSINPLPENKGGPQLCTMQTVIILGTS
jgi:hypothetical protein